MTTESTPAAASAGQSVNPAARMNIGEVLELLHQDFPTISIPKIRFLEEKGIVTPERTSSGYRKFALADVERLRYALLLQRDHHQPLARIVEILDAIDRGLEPPPLVDLTPAPGGPPPPRPRGGGPRPRPPCRARSPSGATTTCASRAGSCSRSPRS